MTRTDRLVAMVMQLQGRRVVRAEELAEHFEISVRTVYRDIAALGEAGVPVAGEAGVGYSLVKGYHLPPVMFTADEAVALANGEALVRRFTDRSVAAPMAMALAKIRAVLPRERQDELDRLAQTTAIDGDTRPAAAPDRRTLLPIQQATIARRVLRIDYRTGDAVDSRRDIEPLGLACYGGAWYLIAWCRLRRDYRHFRLDRVRGLETLPEKFAARPDFSLQQHLAATVSAGQSLQVELRFAPAALPRARRESYGAFLSEQPAREGVTVTMRTYSFAWLARWLLSFGDDAEALAPAELRRLVAAEAEKIVRRYSKKGS